MRTYIRREPDGIPVIVVELSRPTAKAIVDEVRAVKPGGLTRSNTEALADLLGSELGRLLAEDA